MNRQHATLIDRIEQSGQDFLKYLGQLSDEEIHQAPSPNEWSIHAIAAHMRDTEQHVFLKRLRRILNADAPPAVENFDQEEWSREHYSADEPVKKIARDFRAARRQQVNLLKKVRDKDWARWAVHPHYGKISIEWLETHNYAHTLEHLHQLLEIQERGLLKKLNG